MQYTEIANTLNKIINIDYPDYVLIITPKKSIHDQYRFNDAQINQLNKHLIKHDHNFKLLPFNAEQVKIIKCA